MTYQKTFIKILFVNSPRHLKQGQSTLPVATWTLTQRFRAPHNVFTVHRGWHPLHMLSSPNCRKMHQVTTPKGEQVSRWARDVKLKALDVWDKTQHDKVWGFQPAANLTLQADMWDVEMLADMTSTLHNNEPEKRSKVCGQLPWRWIQSWVPEKHWYCNEFMLQSFPRTWSPIKSCGWIGPDKPWLHSRVPAVA